MNKKIDQLKKDKDNLMQSAFIKEEEKIIHNLDSNDYLLNKIPKVLEFEKF